MQQRPAQQSNPTEIVSSSSDQLQSSDVIHVENPLFWPQDGHLTPFGTAVKIERNCDYCRILQPGTTCNERTAASVRGVT
jgi:hypothetical protein